MECSALFGWRRNWPKMGKCFPYLFLPSYLSMKIEVQLGSTYFSHHLFPFTDHSILANTGLKWETGKTISGVLDSKNKNAHNTQKNGIAKHKKWAEECTRIYDLVISSQSNIFQNSMSNDTRKVAICWKIFAFLFIQMWYSHPMVILQLHCLGYLPERWYTPKSVFSIWMSYLDETKSTIVCKIAID